MQRDDLVYVGHMLDQARKAREKIHGVERSDFDRDENLQMTLAYLIQTIGEAARRVSSSFQSTHSDVPWAKVVGMRHRIVHDQIDAKNKFDIATLQIAGRTYPASRPGRFLRDWDRSATPPRRWIEVLIADLIQLMHQLV